MKDPRVFERQVRFVNPLKLLGGSVLQIRSGLKPIRVPNTHEI
jgi:hypothetical protein